MFGLRTFVENGKKFFDDIILILYKAIFLKSKLRFSPTPLFSLNGNKFQTSLSRSYCKK